MPDASYRVIGSSLMVLGLVSVVVSLLAGSFNGFNWEHLFLMLGGMILAVIGFAITQTPEHTPRA